MIISKFLEGNKKEKGHGCDFCYNLFNENYITN